LAKKIDNQKGLKAIVFKHAYFAKRLGDITQGLDGFKEFAKTCYELLKNLMLLFTGGAALTGPSVSHALHHAAVTLHPLIHALTHISSTMLSFAGENE
jgi:hypothetical protein